MSRSNAAMQQCPRFWKLSHAVYSFKCIPIKARTVFLLRQIIEVDGSIQFSGRWDMIILRVYIKLRFHLQCPRHAAVVRTNACIH